MQRFDLIIAEINHEHLIDRERQMEKKHVGNDDDNENREKPSKVKGATFCCRSVSSPIAESQCMISRLFPASRLSFSTLV